MPNERDPAPIRTSPQPTCPLCSSSGTLVHRSLVDRAHNVPGEWSVLACADCRIGWLDPQPIDEDIGRCYPRNYYTHAAETPLSHSPFDSTGIKGRARGAILAGRYGYPVESVGATGRRFGQLLGMVQPIRQRVAYTTDDSLPIWRSGGRLLDIGCGAGSFLKVAQSLGWSAFGIDPDAVAAENARRIGAKVDTGTLDTVTPPDAPFDAVTSMHSIEHARDPRRFLRQALALLRKGGFFYLQTPNFGSLMHRRYKGDWYALEISRHLCFLTVPAMRNLLNELTSWSSLTVRSNPRRAMREQEQTIAMRRTGSFEADTPFTAMDRLGMRAWSVAETAGNALMHWGEEVEVIGIRA